MENKINKIDEVETEGMFVEVTTREENWTNPMTVYIIEGAQ